MARHFTDTEVGGLRPELVDLLDRARDLTTVPFIITSGYRSAAQNEAVGGVRDSSHESGLAVDLKNFDGNAAFQIVKALLAVGFRRLGIYNYHIHVDIDLSKPQNVIWTGVSH
jgi:uncharacterized protein YcbK (DUF882 family)